MSRESTEHLKRLSVGRLEQYLQAWEDSMQNIELTDRAFEVGKFDRQLDYAPHHRELRKTLLSLQDIRKFDSEKFWVRAPAGTEGKRAHELLNLFPTLLAQWMTGSRRVYHPDADLELSLLATKLGDVRWSDVTFPFDSFGISLDIPLKDSENGKEWDFILINKVDSQVSTLKKQAKSFIASLFKRKLDIVSDVTSPLEKVREVLSEQKLLLPYKHYGGESFIVISLFNTKLKNFKPTPVAELQKAREALARKNPDRAIRLLDQDRMSTYIDGISSFGHSLAPWSTIEEITHRKDGTRDDSTWADAVRITAGLLQYLSMLSEGRNGSKMLNEERFTNKRNALNPDKKAVTDEADVCTVTSSYTLSKKEREIFTEAVINRTSGYEVSAHFRSGYWHRPKNSGLEATKKNKTLWTRPTIVRRDRLPEDALPGGSEVKVK